MATEINDWQSMTRFLPLALPLPSNDHPSGGTNKKEIKYDFRRVKGVFHRGSSSNSEFDICSRKRLTEVPILEEELKVVS